MKVFESKDKCCACGACREICPRNAIVMKQDEYGFLYPKVSEEKCINCGLCRKTCAYVEGNIGKYPINVFAAYSQNKKIIEGSSSGGVFTTIADNFVRKGGLASGAVYDFDGKVDTLVHHIVTGNQKGLQLIQNSKYAHSDAGVVFKEIREALSNNKKVLFSGTPCQVAALKKFLGKHYDNLYTIDIVCHGVPSKKMFGDYLEILQKKYKCDSVKNFAFRNKIHGWNCSYCDIFNKNGEMFSERTEYSSYYSYFLEGRIYRENCYSCPYAQQKRHGDITIGDFWGIERLHPEYLLMRKDSSEGWSCILVNTDKGQNLLNEYGSDIKLFDSTYEKCSKENTQLVRPVLKPKNSGVIMESYKNSGYKTIEKRFFWRKVILFIKHLIPNQIKQPLKKILGRL